MYRCGHPAHDKLTRDTIICYIGTCLPVRRPTEMIEDAALPTGQLDRCRRCAMFQCHCNCQRAWLGIPFGQVRLA